MIASIADVGIAVAEEASPVIEEEGLQLILLGVGVMLATSKTTSSEDAED